MADLDSFFAKKDKKKTKNSKRFVTKDELVKNLEESKYEKVSRNEDLSHVTDNDITDNLPQEEDDEWMNYKEEKKDYTGLKIGQLVCDVDELHVIDSNEDCTNCDLSKTNDLNETNSTSSIVWKPVAPPPVVTVPTEPVIKEIKPKKYTPPVFRQPQHKVQPLSSKSAPDINSEDYFPTLKPKEPPAVSKKNKKQKSKNMNGST